jgi:hypothetical protein
MLQRHSFVTGIRFHGTSLIEISFTPIREGTAFLLLIFMEFKYAHQPYMQTYYTEFHSNLNKKFYAPK